jgi:predicted nuclease of predicted toxin-antitoxin system
LIRLLLDQGLPRSAATFLNDAGWDVVHVGDIGMSRASDQQILDHARRDQRVCVTLDADFHALLALSKAKAPSVIRIRQEGLTGAELAHLLKIIWPRLDQALRQGAMVSVTHRAIRVRRLPIGSQSKSGG